MTLISTKLLPAQNAARAELARTKRAATILLAIAFVTALIARAIQHLHPALGFLAALPRPRRSAAPIGSPWWRSFAIHSACRSRIRDYPEQPASHRDQPRRIRPGAFSRGRGAKLKSIDFVDVVRR
jgi:hypothetical protein